MAISRSTNAYIRTVIDNGEDFLVVCFHGSQAQLWSRAPTFQLDTKCKKLHDKVQYEVIFGARIGFGNQYISLARAYMTSRTALAYKRLFQELFSCLEHQCKVQIRWQHIHQQGIIGVTLDQDAGAIQGLGEYLHSIDSSHDVEWHLMNCVRYCQVRFDRSISDQCSELGDTDRSKDSMWQKMKTLPEALTSQAYFELCDIIETDYPCLKYWIRHKKIPIIASGLCHGVSSLSRKHWDSMSADINGVECLHEQSYRTGGHFISLLYAIKSAEVLDFQQLRRLATASSNGASTGYPTSVQTQRDETSSQLNLLYLIKLTNQVPNKKSLGTALQVILHSMNHQKSMAMEDPHQNQMILVCQGHRRHILQDLNLRSVQYQRCQRQKKWQDLLFQDQSSQRQQNAKDLLLPDQPSQRQPQRKG
ncbi:hypothetical protein E4U32_004706 [Claviceps aff. humidiphila group G2b]|nr:hypothetical protein E4U32_004706 [Claviceps aff. humidiphila group G2b]